MSVAALHQPLPQSCNAVVIILIIRWFYSALLKLDSYAGAASTLHLFIPNVYQKDTNQTSTGADLLVFRTLSYHTHTHHTTHDMIGRLYAA